MSICKCLLAGASAFLSLTTFANAGVINGGFETPGAPISNFTEFAGGSDLGGWTVTGSDVLLIAQTYSEPGITFNPNGGSQAVDLTGRGNTGFADGVTQAVSTVVGQMYTLSFFVGRADDSIGGLGKYLTDSTIRLTLDGGNTLTSFTNTDKTVGGVNWKQFTTTFTATDILTEISFLNGTDVLPGGNNYAGLDDVQVQAVPEPASMAIFGIGAIVVGAGNYRRRRQQSRDC